MPFFQNQKSVRLSRPRFFNFFLFFLNLSVWAGLVRAQTLLCSSICSSSFKWRGCIAQNLNNACNTWAVKGKVNKTNTGPTSTQMGLWQDAAHIFVSFYVLCHPSQFTVHTCHEWNCSSLPDDQEWRRGSPSQFLKSWEGRVYNSTIAYLDAKGTC